MTPRHIAVLANTLLALAFVAGWLALAAWFDTEREAVDQQHATQPDVQQRKATAALKICGPGAAPKWLDDTTLSCQPHTGRGRTTVTAGVTP